MLGLHGYEASLVSGAWVTLQVALWSLLISVILGILTALAKLSKTLPLRVIGTLYTTVIRGIPDLVLMLLIFYGGQMLVNVVAESVGYEEYIDVNPFIAGVLTIGFIFGAYMAETFRGAIMAVDQGQLEAGKAYGMSSWMIFRRILFPQMMRHALPGFGNNWLVLLKTTALVAIIGLEDMVRKAQLASGSTQEPFTFYFAVCLIFLLYTTVSILLLNWAERHFSASVRREA
ncbi:ABC transporter permease [Zooshikella ganghwensis]|uniref:ABC transporter permease n=1 Tax=Zooshikella ganghwensis TaxID=202772 RepID=A0A4P9VQB9_9GAMM|nr:ABC transporter permease [Zooshikella ganghwensis]RDH44564.1 ABC transporter permease [Zooshikella ganghwensis]